MIKKIINSFKKLSKVKKILVITGVIAIGFGIKKLTAKDEDTVVYKTEKVSKGEVVSLVSETGEITTSGKIDVNSTINGMVEEVYVKNGDTVKSGQNLYKVKSSASDIDKAESYFTYVSAKNSLESAKANLYTLQAKMFGEWDEFVENAEKDEYDENHTENRNLPEYHIPEKEWLAAEAGYKNQQQVIAATQTNLNKAWLNYQAVTSGTVKSPIEGVVANLSINTGQEVSTDDVSLMIKNRGDTWVKLAVSETDVSEIKARQKASVSVDAVKKLEIEGIVDRVDDVGTDSSGIITYNVYVNVGQVDESVRAGMTVQIDIETQRVEDSLVVTNSAVKTYQGSKAVQIIDERTGELLYKPVKIGVVGDTKTEIVLGLEEGEEIVIGQTTTSSQTSTSNSGFIGLPGMGH